MRIGFFGSSLVSSYWNGAATYYRGLLKEIAALGHEITFFEPNAFERQAHRDIDDPSWAEVQVYPATETGWRSVFCEAARSVDLLIKASGVGVFDQDLEVALAEIPSRAMRIYWDVDAPATLDAIERAPDHHLRKCLPYYDAVLTYGGGDRVTSGYCNAGARDCVAIYNALDPATHVPVAPDCRFACDLSLLANRLPDREARVDAFFIEVAARRPGKTFVLGGSGWDSKQTPPNIRKVGHVGTGAHNAFFASSLATLNINRDSMAKFGYSPPTRIFEAAGVGACLISDAWEGIEAFLEPGREILIASTGSEVLDLLDALDAPKAKQVAQRARERILAHHTYRHRALQFDNLITGMSTRTEAAE